MTRWCSTDENGRNIFKFHVHLKSPGPGPKQIKIACSDRWSAVIPIRNKQLRKLKDIDSWLNFESPFVLVLTRGQAKDFAEGNNGSNIYPKWWRDSADAGRNRCVRWADIRMFNLSPESWQTGRANVYHGHNYKSPTVCHTPLIFANAAAPEIILRQLHVWYPLEIH